MTDKLRECFDEMAVYKDLKKSNFFASLKLPSFLRDWLIKKFSDDEGNLVIEEVSSFVHTYLPNKDEWLSIKNRIIHENERVKILTKIAVDIDIKTGDVSFSLPDFGLSTRETVIEPHIWERVKNDLVSRTETWGVVELGYRIPNDEARPKITGKIKLTDFSNFCPYSTELEFFKDVREEFSTEQWIDIILGAVDYNAGGYENEEQKVAMLMRLLPFVEKNLNIIELAPKGTGKSYLFGNVSRFGLLTDGGKITRAKMFYDTGRRTVGFISGNDFVAIDEIKLVQFGDINEMRSIMQGYMERGKFNIGGYEGTSDAGIIFLGNIEQSKMDENQNMLTELPSIFQESALLDRIHGFIKGWQIPPMKEELKVMGWALNSEYFSSIMHLLRDDISYRAIVDELVLVPEGAYIRHIEAVKRLTTAFLKLLFPNVRTVSDVNTARFVEYCLNPAIKMRGVILRQLEILDPDEYCKPNKSMPEFSLRDGKYKVNEAVS